jgi:hypothetical protein
MSIRSTHKKGFGQSKADNELAELLRLQLGRTDTHGTAGHSASPGYELHSGWEVHSRHRGTWKDYLAHLHDSASLQEDWTINLAGLVDAFGQPDEDATARRLATLEREVEELRQSLVEVRECLREAREADASFDRDIAELERQLGDKVGDDVADDYDYSSVYSELGLERD